MKLREAVRHLKRKREYLERKLLVATLVSDTKRAWLQREVAALDAVIEAFDAPSLPLP